MTCNMSIKGSALKISIIKVKKKAFNFDDR